MLYGYGFLIALVMAVYCSINVITTPEAQVRNLPKLLWLVLVLLFPVVGGIAWLVAGRPLRTGTAGLAYTGNAGIPPEYDRPGRARAGNPDDDAAFLESLKARAEEQRKRAQERRDREEGEPPQA